ncbi:STY4528 family pathogenicity island replication protein [Halopseudomonas xiamenensis]|uniref:STY4528 family pathogenicity island replication protein n=1 Tax=Halopseudomonas xiamenensis TaxID=157792 RepID=UPI00162AAE69|nr:STY4528 family pathogenicity island replication protein [Halopseudomonas xiamenensis]
MRTVDDWQVLVGRATSAITQRADAGTTEPSTGETLDGLLFFGNPHETVPRALLLDSSLGAVDVLGWQMIRLLSTSDRTTAFPTYDQLQPLLRSAPGTSASRGTVARVIAVLRLTRWLSLCHKARHDTNGRIMGNVYALHDEPLAADEATMLDPTYCEFVEHCLEHSNSAVRAVAKLVLDEMQQDGGGRSVSRLNRRIQRFAEMSQGRSRKAQASAEQTQFPERTKIENQVKSPSSQSELGQFPDAPKPGSQRELSGNTGLCTPVRSGNQDSTVQVRIYKNTSTVPGDQDLLWDSALQMSDQERSDLTPTLGRLERETAQWVLDETAGRVSAGKARSPKALLRSLINLALKGEFKVTTYAHSVRSARQPMPAVPVQPNGNVQHTVHVTEPELPRISAEEAHASRQKLLAAMGLRR